MSSLPARLQTEQKPESSVLISGASGFVGRAVVSAFSRQGWRVFGTPSRAGTSSTSGFIPIDSSEINPAGLKKLDITSCIHLAESPNSNEPAILRHQKARLRSLLDAEFNHLVYFSSGKVYGTKSNLVLDESSPLSPEDAYSQYKAEAEQIVGQAQFSSILRPSNIYGPHCHPKSVVAKIIEQAKHQPRVLRLHQRGATRDFIHVYDVAEAVMKLVTKGLTGVHNLSTAYGTSLEELAHIALAIANSPGTLVDFADPIERNSNLVLSNSKIIKALKWQPAFSLKTGLRTIM